VPENRLRIRGHCNVRKLRRVCVPPLLIQLHLVIRKAGSSGFGGISRSLRRGLGRNSLQRGPSVWKQRRKFPEGLFVIARFPYKQSHYKRDAIVDSIIFYYRVVPIQACRSIRSQG